MHMSLIDNMKSHEYRLNNNIIECYTPVPLIIIDLQITSMRGGRHFERLHPGMKASIIMAS